MFLELYYMSIKPSGVLLSTGAAALIFGAAITDVSAHGPEAMVTAPATTQIQPMPKSKMMIPGNRLGRLMMPNMDPENGMTLFVTKGCVACHAINGIGGHDVPAMDSHIMGQTMNPFDFAAKMWNHAEGKITAQIEGLGEQILLSGQELADIVAFAHHDDVQHHFTEADLTPQALKMMSHDHDKQPAHIEHSEELNHKIHM